MQRDPNRYAEGLEAVACRARIEDEELALDVLRTGYERAQKAHAETEAQFRQAEQQYLLYKGLLEDSSTYLGKAKSRYDLQAASVEFERVFLHPVRKTPLDILACIFEQCIDDVDCHHALSVETAQIRSRQQQPYHLAAVCRRWRQASLAHPRAWSHVEFSFDLVKSINVAAWSSYLATVLSRARSAPLTACLTRRRDAKPHHEKLATRLTDVVRSCVRVQMKIWHLDTGDPLLALLTTATPKLSLATIQLLAPKSDAVLQNTQVLPNAPALEYIYAQNLFHSAPVALPLVDCARVDDLTCTDETDALGLILRSLPRLDALSLYRPLVAYHRSDHAPQVVPQLETLFLHVRDDCPVEQLSVRLEFTSVTCLTLYGDPPSAESRLRFLHALGRKSPLEDLVISDIGGPLFTLFLDILPSLTELDSLHMECTEFANDDLLALRDALCPRDKTAEWACPRLTSVIFKSSCTFTQDCDPATLADMIASRGSAARDNALDPENRPAALQWLSVEGWKRHGDESIQDKINRAIKAAL